MEPLNQLDDGTTWDWQLAHRLMEALAVLDTVTALALFDAWPDLPSAS